MIGKMLVFAIWIYQGTLGPLFGNCCRFHPSCSNYCIGAIRQHGAVSGLLLGAWRLLRCNPFNSGGFDPVPTSDELRAGVRALMTRLSRCGRGANSGPGSRESAAAGRTCSLLPKEERIP